MKTIIKVAIVSFLTIITYSCEQYFEKAYSMEIRNYSETSINFYFSFMDDEYNRVYYPDTLLPKRRPKRVINLASGSFGFPVSGPWEEIFKSLPNDTLSVYIFNKDTLDKYSWREIREDHKYLIRYDLSAEDLNKLRDVVSYPPSAEMRNMKMYPPYKK